MDKFAFHLEMLFMPQRKRRLSLLFFWMLIVASGKLFFSCADEDCFSVANNDLLVTFNRIDTLESGKIVKEEVDTVFYTIKAVGNDSIYYDSTDVRSKFALPVNPALDFTAFEFQVIDSISRVTDTLSNGQTTIKTVYHLNPNPHIMAVSYDRKQRIISVECGTEIGYVNINVDETTFRETNLVSNKLSRLNEVNVQVFF